MPTPPTGTVTFLFTDIEDSTRLWQERPDAMSIAHARHDAILREAIESNRGFIFHTAGDSFSAAFHTAADALSAALVAQRTLPQGDIIRVRMGVHTGAAEMAKDGSGQYDGYVTIASAQRVMSIAHGGQVLLSQTACDLMQNSLPEGASLRDMGEHRLKDLRGPMHVYQLVAPGLVEDFPPIKSLALSPNNLPIQLTSFIGREKEIADIKGLLDTARLVTLTGSGGTGKTRLSQETGTQLLEDFPHGVWLIELAPLSDPAQIVPAMAQVFNLQELPFSSLENLLLDYLRDKKLLLILDNCEHLIAACARLADELLHQCAGLKMLASSREALGIAGELAYRTPSLAESESAQLFTDRSRAANSSFHLTSSNSAAIRQICSRLDGIPLAIELAAARAKLLSPEQMAARLDDLFRLLVGGSRTALPRQQTLRALIDWSYDLLSDEEKRLLQFASVFAGGWTLDALEAVSEDPDTLELLEQLVNKSLVVTEERETEMRYFMLETIRQYAREKLFEAKASSLARDRHFDYFDGLAQKLWQSLRSANALAFRGRAEDELENLRAALDWGMAHHPEPALRLAAHFCILSGALANAISALELLDIALDQVRSLAPVDGEARLQRDRLTGLALFAQGMVGMGASGFPSVIQSFQEAIAISRATGDKQILGYSLEMYFVTSRFFEAPGGPEAAEEGLAILTEIGDWWGIYLATMNMAAIAALRGDLEAKEKYLAVINARLQEAPLAIQSGMFYLSMANVEKKQGNLELAKKHFEDGLVIFRRLKSRNFEYVMMSELGHLARTAGNLAQAREIYRQTILGWQELGARPAVAHELECFAFITIAQEEPERAARLLGAAEALREKVQSPMTDPERDEYDAALVGLRSMLPDAEFSALWGQGRGMSIEQAVQLAIS